jgi:hypothetical protein
MTYEKQLSNLELRLRMAVEHVSQREQDLNTIRAKAGLPPAKSLFDLDKQAEKPPAGDEGWFHSPAGAEWLAGFAAKGAAGRAAAEVKPSLNEALGARIIALSRDVPPPLGSPHREEWFRLAGTLDAAAAAPAKVTADDIVRAAALARWQIVKLPPVGSPALRYT